MLTFIQLQPHVIERLISHIGSPAIVDLIFRIIQLDELPSGAGVLEVCELHEKSLHTNAYLVVKT